MPKIKVQCPAKINQTLKVTGKRPDGFHNIESIMQTINLYDYLTIEITPADNLSITLSGTSEEIPYNEKNLVYKAAKMFFDEIRNYKYEVNVFIEKNIPVAAGLAGGSTDAAGTLFGLNKLLSFPFNNEELHKLCAKLGSDLNFCLEGGRQLTTGRGEILTPLEFEKSKISLIKPLYLGISAKEAYTKFSKKMENDADGRDNYINDLEWAVIDDYSELQSIKSKYPKSIMSGSGSTYYIKDENFEEQSGYFVKNNLETIPNGIKEVQA